MPCKPGAETEIPRDLEKTLFPLLQSIVRFLFSALLVKNFTSSETEDYG